MEEHLVQFYQGVITYLHCLLQGGHQTVSYAECEVIRNHKDTFLFLKYYSVRLLLVLREAEILANKLHTYMHVYTCICM